MGCQGRWQAGEHLGGPILPHWAPGPPLRGDLGHRIGDVACTSAGRPVDYRYDPAAGRRDDGLECVVTASADQDEARQRAHRLGLESGLTVQELGWDEDIDEVLRAGVEAAIGSTIVDDDYDDVVDVVLMWWREDDGDLVDGLVDAIGPLTDKGVVWLMTPKPGRPGHIEAEEIADAAPTAGLQPTTTVSASPHWQGTRLVAPRAKR